MIGRGEVGEGGGKPVNSILNTCFAIYCSLLGDLCTKNIIKTHCLRRLGPSMLGHRQKKKSQKIALPPIASKFGPQEVNSFSQLRS